MSERPSDRGAIEILARLTGIEESALCGKRRKAEILEGRFLACWLLRNCTDLTTVRIGALLGGKDHSTVVNAVMKIDERRAADLDFRKHTDGLAKKMGRHDVSPSEERAVVFSYIRLQAREEYTTPGIGRIAQRTGLTYKRVQKLLNDLVRDGEIRKEGKTYGVLVNSREGPKWKFTTPKKERIWGNVERAQDYGYERSPMSIFDGHRFENITRAEAAHRRAFRS